MPPRPKFFVKRDLGAHETSGKSVNFGRSGARDGQIASMAKTLGLVSGLLTALPDTVDRAHAQTIDGGGSETVNGAGGGTQPSPGQTL